MPTDEQSPKQTPDSVSHAVQTLRELDYRRYLATLVIPARLRPAVQVVQAFAADVAAIRERVSEPAPGEIRLQWWIDALEGDQHGDVRRNPLASALLDVLKANALPTGPLLRLLAARRFDLYNDPMPDMAQFEGYAGETVSILYQYSAMILDGERAGEAADASGHLGVVQALAGHIRAFGFNAARGQIFLPLSVLNAHGVSEEQIYAGVESDGLRAALDHLSEIALDHAQKANSAVASLPRSLRPAFAATGLVTRELNRPRPAASFSAEHSRSGFVELASLVWWSLRNA